MDRLKPTNNMSPEEAKEFIRKLMGRPSRTLVDKERDHILLLLEMIEPFKQTNNQRCWTDYYMMAGTEYQVTSFPNEDPIVEEMLAED